jgi:hypothetical protein
MFSENTVCTWGAEFSEYREHGHSLISAVQCSLSGENHVRTCYFHNHSLP